MTSLKAVSSFAALFKPFSPKSQAPEHSNSNVVVQLLLGSICLYFYIEADSSWRETVILINTAETEVYKLAST